MVNWFFLSFKSYIWKAKLNTNTEIFLDTSSKWKPWMNVSQNLYVEFTFRCGVSEDEPSIHIFLPSHYNNEKIILPCWGQQNWFWQRLPIIICMFIELLYKKFFWYIHFFLNWKTITLQKLNFSLCTVFLIFIERWITRNIASISQNQLNIQN